MYDTMSFSVYAYIMMTLITISVVLMAVALIVCGVFECDRRSTAVSCCRCRRSNTITRWFRHQTHNAHDLNDPLTSTATEPPWSYVNYDSRAPDEPVWCTDHHHTLLSVCDSAWYVHVRWGMHVIRKLHMAWCHHQWWWHHRLSFVTSLIHTIHVKIDYGWLIHSTII